MTEAQLGLDVNADVGAAAILVSGAGEVEKMITGAIKDIDESKSIWRASGEQKSGRRRNENANANREQFSPHALIKAEVCRTPASLRRRRTGQPLSQDGIRGWLRRRRHLLHLRELAVLSSINVAGMTVSVIQYSVSGEQERREYWHKAQGEESSRLEALKTRDAHYVTLGHGLTRLSIRVHRDLCSFTHAFSAIPSSSCSPP